MNSGGDKPESEIPLKPVESSPDPEPAAEDHEVKKRGCCGGFALCCRTFINSTTIRGIKHTTGEKTLCLRVFWTIFIFLSFCLVVTVSTFCIIAYASFQTVVRQHKRPLYGRDFPVVTLCSDGLFGDTAAIRSFSNHPLAYDTFVTAALKRAMAAGDFKRLRAMVSLRSMTQYNVNNLDVLLKLVRDEIEARPVKDFNIRERFGFDFTCKVGDATCETKPFVNLKYRNCISSLVKYHSYNDEISRMTITGFLMSLKEPPVLPPEQSSTGVFLSGRHIHVYLHEMNTLPRDRPDFVISMSKDRWVLIDFDMTHLTRIITPRQSCASSPVENTTHTGDPIRLTPTICRQIALRQVVRKDCKCEMPVPPFDKWPLNNTHFCGHLGRGLNKAISELKCVAFLSYTNFPTPDCETPCSERSYQSRISIDNFERSALNRVTREMLLSESTGGVKRICKRKRLRKRCQQMKKMINFLLNNPTIDFNQYQVQVLSGSKVTSSYWKLAFPANASSEVINSKKDLEKITFSITVRSPKMQVDAESESLVRSIWTTLAQVGGASSFLAGFSFGVVAEVIDTCYRFACNKGKV